MWEKKKLFIKKKVSQNNNFSTNTDLENRIRCEEKGLIQIWMMITIDLDVVYGMCYDDGVEDEADGN